MPYSVSLENSFSVVVEEPHIFLVFDFILTLCIAVFDRGLQMGFRSGNVASITLGIAMDPLVLLIVRDSLADSLRMRCA